jgi:hypothetical protein
MTANEKRSTLSEGEALLRRLFGVAFDRLHDRGVAMQYLPGVVDWMLNQPDWQTSLNPLRTLDGVWHQQVASVIEELLLEKRLRRGSTLLVRIDESPTGFQLHFEIDGPAPAQ